MPGIVRILNHREYAVDRVAVYLGISVLTTGIFMTALGPGLFGGDPAYWYTSWQRVAFSSFCHQIPARSFSINGVQMAVCSRCIGIYGALWFGSVILPIAGRWYLPSLSFRRYLLVTSMVIIIIDVSGCLAGLWTDSNISRLITGLFLGLSAAWVVTGNLFSVTQQSI